MQPQKIFQHIHEALPITNRWKDLGWEVVFTNGCFDVLHPGHLKVITRAAGLGEKLIIGLNSDASVSRIKGSSRPIHHQDDRSEMLAAIEMVDMVILFDEDTPGKLIDRLLPDVLVKGGDYKLDEIVGSDVVIEYGGKVEIVPFLEGHSTTGILNSLNKS